MNERLMPLDGFLATLNPNPIEWLREVEDISILKGISKEKQEKITHLIGLLRIKHEKYYKMRMAKSATLNNQIIMNDLQIKYSIGTTNQELGGNGSILFGLSEDDVNIGLVAPKKVSIVEDSQSSQTIPKSLLSGSFSAHDFPSKLLLMKIKMLKLMLTLQKENCETVEYLHIYGDLAEKMAHLLLLKQKTIMKAVETYHKAIKSLNVEAMLLKYKILKNYYSEEGVVKASEKLKSIIITEVENLERKEAELQRKVVAFKKLEGTNYDNLLRDYLLVCQSICNKKWTLENMK